MKWISRFFKKGEPVLLGHSAVERGKYRMTLSWHLYPCLHFGFTLAIAERTEEGEWDGLIINGSPRAFVEAERLLRKATNCFGDVKDAYQDAIRSGLNED